MLDKLDSVKRQGWLVNDVYALQNLMESFFDFEPLTPQLSSIGVPTMILNGEFDFLTPRALHETLRVHIPDSALVIIPRAYHAFTLEKPALTADLLARFAEDVLGGRWQGNKAVWIAPEASGRRACSISCRLRSSARHSNAGSDHMSEFFGPLDSEGRVPPRQQTRVAAFLISAHGALARQFASALPVKLEVRMANRTERAILSRIRDRLAAAARDHVGARSRTGLSGCHPGKRRGFHSQSK